MRALAGSDFVLMPSLYEPCGLPQMMGPRFGTLAVARGHGSFDAPGGRTVSYRLEYELG